MKKNKKIILFNIANFMLNLFRAIEKFLENFIDKIYEYVDLITSTITKIVEIILFPIVLILMLPLFIIKGFFLVLTKIFDTALNKKYCLMPQHIRDHYKFLKAEIKYQERIIKSLKQKKE